MACVQQWSWSRHLGLTQWPLHRWSWLFGSCNILTNRSYILLIFHTYILTYLSDKMHLKKVFFRNKISLPHRGPFVTKLGLYLRNVCKILRLLIPIKSILWKQIFGPLSSECTKKLWPTMKRLPGQNTFLTFFFIFMSSSAEMSFLGAQKKVKSH
jgi:hypothetical protein